MNKNQYKCQNIFMIKLSMFEKFLIYGIIGVFMEIIWTGFNSFLKLDYTLTGHSSILMLPIYGMAVFLEPIFIRLKNLSIIYRGLIYAILILCCEFVTGYILKGFGICPWDYTAKGINIMGLIRLDYIPLWFFAGLFFEWLNKRLSVINININE